MLPILLLLGAGAYALSGGSRRLPPGQNPYDAFPLGVNSAAPLAVQQFKGSSGKRYKVTAFGCADGRTYFVAEKRGDVDWLSYFVDAGGARSEWAANADKHEEIDEMRRDFDLAGGAVT